MKNIKLKISRENLKWVIYHTLDFFLAPLSYLVARFNVLVRKDQFKYFTIAKKLFFKVGVYPILDHYYEPLFNPVHLKRSLRIDRFLPGINLNTGEQLELLKKFDFNDELLKFPIYPTQKTQQFEFCYTDDPFRSGDAEYLYSIIRLLKPQKIIEIGSGSSTLMTLNAIKKNRTEVRDYQCELNCIEPFEKSWLEELGVKIHRSMVENFDISFFEQLSANDILFIDSSHMIRPQGDVLFEYLEVLPTLKSGVIVHIHDIFTPKDYLSEWIEKSVMWNEQYLLEAFLSNNKDFRIIGALNYLRHNHYEEFSAKCPVLKLEIENNTPREPGSFWIIKN